MPLSVTAPDPDVSTSIRQGFSSGSRVGPCDWIFAVIHAGVRLSRADAGASCAWWRGASAAPSPAGRMRSSFSTRVTPSTPRAISPPAVCRCASVSTVPSSVTRPSLVSTSMRCAFTSGDAKNFAWIRAVISGSVGRRSAVFLSHQTRPRCRRAARDRIQKGRAPRVPRHSRRHAISCVLPCTHAKCKRAAQHDTSSVRCSHASCIRGRNGALAVEKTNGRARRRRAREDKGRAAAARAEQAHG